MSTYLDDLIQRLEAEELAQREHLMTSSRKRASEVSYDQLIRTLQRLQTLRARKTKENRRV